MNDSDISSDILSSNKSLFSGPEKEEEDNIELEQDSLSQDLENIDNKLNLFQNHDKIEMISLNYLMNITNEIKILREQAYVNESRYRSENKKFTELLNEKNKMIEALNTKIVSNKEEIIQEKEKNIRTDLSNRNLQAEIENLRNENKQLNSRFLLEIEQKTLIQFEINQIKYQYENSITSIDKLKFELTQNYAKIQALDEENSKLNELLNSLPSNVNLDGNIDYPNFSLLKSQKEEFYSLFPEEMSLLIEKKDVFEYLQILLNKLRQMGEKVKLIESYNYPNRVDILNLEAESYKAEIMQLQSIIQVLGNFLLNFFHLMNFLEKHNAINLQKIQEHEALKTFYLNADQNIKQLQAQIDDYTTLLGNKDRIIRELEILIEMYESELNSKKTESMQI